MSSKFEENQKDDCLCAADGCGHLAEVRWGSKGWCAFHAELFDRGTAFQKASPLVARFAAYPPVMAMRFWLAKCERSILADELADSVAEVAKIGAMLGIPPTVLERRLIVDGIGESVPEAGRMYARRLSNYLTRFIVDRACEKLDLPAVGKTVRVPKEVA